MRHKYTSITYTAFALFFLAVSARAQTAPVYTDSQKQALAEMTSLSTQSLQTCIGSPQKCNQLLEHLLKLAEDNKLGRDPLFSQTVVPLTNFASAAQQNPVVYKERLLRIIGPGEPTETTDGLCMTIWMMKFPTGQGGGIAEELDRYPVCANVFGKMQDNLKSATAIGHAMQNKDYAEAQRLGATAEQVEQMRRSQAALDDAKKGDYHSMLALSRERDGGDDSPRRSSMGALLLMLSDDMPAARREILRMPKEVATEQGLDRAPLPGAQDLVPLGPEAKSGPQYSLPVTYDLRIAHDDQEVKRAALQLIFSEKSKDVEDVRSAIQQLKDRKRGSLAAQLMSEYTKTSEAWTQTAWLDEKPLSQHDINAAAARMEHLENEVDALPGDPPAGPTVNEVQNALGPHDALIEFAEVWLPQYHHGKKPPFEFKASPPEINYVAYVLKSKGEISSFDLGLAAKVDAELKTYRSLMVPPREGASQDSLRQAAHELYKLVWKPLEQSLPGGGRIYISPDSDLALLPFDGLVDESGKYLVQSWDVSYLTSGRQLAEMKSWRGTSKGVSIFATSRFTGQLHTRVADLPAATKEAEAIQRIFPNATLFTNDAATKQQLKAVVSPQILHLATHGYHIDAPQSATTTDAEQAGRNPKYRFLRSGLVLSAPGDKGLAKDGVITSLEIALLDLRRSDLVVLSACDSGVGDTTFGGSVTGMRAAFMMAGAKAVISSLWTVSDVQGAELMKRFYQGLAENREGKNLTINQALREAKLSMIDRSPYYWAPFVMDGKDQVLHF